MVFTVASQQEGPGFESWLPFCGEVACSLHGFSVSANWQCAWGVHCLMTAGMDASDEFLVSLLLGFFFWFFCTFSVCEKKIERNKTKKASMELQGDCGIKLNTVSSSTRCTEHSTCCLSSCTWILIFLYNQWMWREINLYFPLPTLGNHLACEARKCVLNSARRQTKDALITFFRQNILDTHSDSVYMRLIQTLKNPSSVFLSTCMYMLIIKEGFICERHFMGFSNLYN